MCRGFVFYEPVNRKQPRKLLTALITTRRSYFKRRWHVRIPSHISSGRVSIWSAAGQDSEGQRGLNIRFKNKIPNATRNLLNNPLRKHFGRGKQPTRWGSVAIQQVVVLCGVEVHDDAGSIQQLLVTAGTGDAVVAVPAVTSVVQLLWLHLATHRSPEQGEETEGWVSGCLGFELS